MYKHQKLRKQAPEIEALKMGMGCNQNDFTKPFVFVGSTAGDSHPGSIHLLEMANNLKEKIDETEEYKAFRYFATDICDGMAQGHEGMYYSLPSREMIANMFELQALSSPYDYAIYLSSCDKGIPGSLMAMCRNNIPSIFVPGGVMKIGKSGVTLEQVGLFNSQYIRGEIDDEEFMRLKAETCPNAGACAFMGTAATMQVIAEALGLALPGTALIPTHVSEFKKLQNTILDSLDELKEHNLKPSDIVTESSIKNALIIHAAVGGSTNALLHIPAICHELGIDFDPNWINEINSKITVMTNIRPVGEYGSEYFWYAGGVPILMDMLRGKLDLEALTVTGKTLGENINELKSSGFFDNNQKRFNNLDVEACDVLKPAKIFGSEHILLLKGNIAKAGSVIKASGLSDEVRQMELTCKVFDSENEAIDAIVNKQITPGTAIIVRYCGPKANGMPEMFYLTEALANDVELSKTCALITDGRFSGASRGPIIGHVSPEAAADGLIKYVIDGDVLQIDVKNRSINITNCDETSMKARVVVEKRYEHCGLLKLYTENSESSIFGGMMKGE